MCQNTEAPLQTSFLWQKRTCVQPKNIRGTCAVQETRRFQSSKLGKNPNFSVKCETWFSNMHSQCPHDGLLKVEKAASSLCSSFALRTDLQNGIKTAPNKTAAAAKNNIHLLFNLECQLVKQLPCSPNVLWKRANWLSYPEPRKASYQDTGTVISPEFRSSEFI